MTPALALQAQMRALLAGDSAVTALVPAASIFDRHKSPEVFPKIVLGEGQEISDDLTLARDTVRVFAILHIWTRDGGLAGAKAIGGAVRKALVGKITGFIDFRHIDSHYMRDPDGETAHGVVTFEALTWEPSE
jgi:hypothetical protein